MIKKIIAVSAFIVVIVFSSIAISRSLTNGSEDSSSNSSDISSVISSIISNSESNLVVSSVKSESTIEVPDDGNLTSNAVGIAKWSDNVKISFNGDSFNFTSNGIPSHELPDQFVIPNDGNMPPFNNDDPDDFSIINTDELIVETPLDVDITLNPVYSETVTQTSLGQIGVLISGAQLFNDYEDMQLSSVALDDNFSIDGASFVDSCNGHPLQSGDNYHYHGVPYCITDVVDVEGQHSSIVGFLIDGFPVYGSKDVDGVEITNEDLDECGGHFGMTPEFDQEIYHYHLTEDEAPYSIDCFHGEVDYAVSTMMGPPPRQ